VTKLTSSTIGWAGAPYVSVRTIEVRFSSRWLHALTMSVAGGVAYYFAKREINAERAAKYEAQRKKKQMIESMEYSDNVPSRPLSSSTMGGTASTANSNANGGPARTDAAGSPSQESSSSDPAPTRHAPATESQRVLEKSKYESTSQFRSRKGDRFS
jgi:Domain of unknown function (DUF4748)